MTANIPWLQSAPLFLWQIKRSDLVNSCDYIIVFRVTTPRSRLSPTFRRNLPTPSSRSPLKYVSASDHNTIFVPVIKNARLSIARRCGSLVYCTMTPCSLVQEHTSFARTRLHSSSGRYTEDAESRALRNGRVHYQTTRRHTPGEDSDSCATPR
jgi:hypothetical protein